MGSVLSWSTKYRYWVGHGSMKKPVLKTFAIIIGKHLYWSLFLMKLQAFRTVTLLEKDSNADVFLCILGYFLEQLVWGISAKGFLLYLCRMFYFNTLQFLFYGNVKV